MRRTLFDKLWDAHVIRDLGGGWSLLHVDRNLMHDLSGPDAFRNIRARGIAVANPELVIATPDHAVSSAPGRTAQSSSVGAPLHATLQAGTVSAHIRLLDIGSGMQGIVHVIGPELGLILPGLSVACGDSHTCTNGAMGALAFGIGSSEAAHVLATQTLRLKRPRSMRVRLEGRLGRGCTPKDIVLHVIRTLGTAAGAGYAVEFAGPAIRDMSIEGRLTVCNMAAEMGARYGVIAPDERTFEYVRGRPFSPDGGVLAQAIENWKQLTSDAGACFDKDVVIDVSNLAPTVTWGTSPEQAIAVDEFLPQLHDFSDPDKLAAARAAFDYMGLEPGRPLAGTPVDRVFIGSCSNARLSDLQAAAVIVEGRKVAKGVRAWVVPGSETVQREAEQAGLDEIFMKAGFEWRDPGCSMCAAANGEQVSPGARCISTSNRNFVGRQGPRARTHLSSPPMAAAAAIVGAFIDVRELT